MSSEIKLKIIVSEILTISWALLHDASSTFAADGGAYQKLFLYLEFNLI